MVTLRSDRPHAWERWLPAWHALAGIALLLTNGLTVVELGVTNPRTWAALAVSAAAAAWYWALFVRVRPWEPPLWQMIVYVAGVMLAWSALASLSPAYYLLQAAIFPQFFFALPMRLAAIAAIGFTLLITALASGFPAAELDLLAMAGNLSLIVVLILLSAWIGRIIDQSAERSQLIAQLEATRAELAAMERQAGTLEERQRLAREIHDTLAQGFTSVVMHLEAADAALLADADRAGHHLGEARRIARDSLTESRRVLAALRPDVLRSSSLVETLQRVVADWSRETDTPARFMIVGSPLEVGAEADVTLLRTAQEALANIRKHATAHEVTVTLSYHPDEVALDIHDDGVGFEPGRAAVTTAGGMGLIGMRERAARIGASVSVESTPGGGTTIAVAVPAPQPGTGDRRETESRSA